MSMKGSLNHVITRQLNRKSIPVLKHLIYLVLKMGFGGHQIRFWNTQTYYNGLPKLDSRILATFLENPQIYKFRLKRHTFILEILCVQPLVISCSVHSSLRIIRAKNKTDVKSNMSQIRSLSLTEQPFYFHLIMSLKTEDFCIKMTTRLYSPIVKMAASFVYHSKILKMA